MKSHANCLPTCCVWHPARRSFFMYQTRPEDQEDLCRSIEDKLGKRKGTLTRSKDRLKLECDRR